MNYLFLFTMHFALDFLSMTLEEYPNFLTKNFFYNILSNKTIK